MSAPVDVDQNRLSRQHQATFSMKTRKKIQFISSKNLETIDCTFVNNDKYL